MKRKKGMHFVSIAIAIILLMLFAGCTIQPSESQYVVEVDDEGVVEKIGQFDTSESQTILGLIIQEWRFFTIVFMLITVMMVSLAYPISTAFGLPGLKAWADIELAEVFSTAIVVVFVLSILVFIELFTHGLTAATPGFSEICQTSTFCPIAIAQSYVQNYIGATKGVYGDLMENAVKSGKLGSMSIVLGSNWMWLGYVSFSFKPVPNYMIDVTTAGQELQFLLGMRDALFFQQFILNHISATLAPMALMIGIIFRSFFVTRKLGGLLMAFGIGFLLVFPLTYAIAYFTTSNTLYGSSVTGGEITTELCTPECRQVAPIAYEDDTGEPLLYSDITKRFYRYKNQSDPDYLGEEEYKEWYDHFVSGSFPYDVADDGTTIYTCGAYDGICPPTCRELPYPNFLTDCASRMTEYNCRENVPEECFIIRYANLDNEELEEGLEEGDLPNSETCPARCRPLNGLKKEGCDIGYGFYLYPEMTVKNVDNKMAADEYSGWDLSTRCEKEYPFFFFFCKDNDNAELALKLMAFEEVKENNTIAWNEGCPNRCRWVSTKGRSGPGCAELCNLPSASAAATALHDARTTDLAGQIALAKEQCYLIIPEKVFTDPECGSCDYLIDPGFASYPPIHQRCDKLCGGKRNLSPKKDEDSYSSITEGFNGPAEMKAVTKVIVPALILPMFNIVITFIFIRTLSPMLGGDIDIPGMMRMIR